MEHAKRLVWLAITAAALVAFWSPGGARANTVTEWNGYTNGAIFASVPTAHGAMLKTAMVQGAVYDAVNAVVGGYQPYLAAPTAAAGSSPDAAAVEAGYRVARAIVIPAQQAVLDGRYNTWLATTADTPARAGGIAVGAAAAAAMLAARTNDGRDPTTAFPFVFGTLAGEWRTSPPVFAIDPTAWVGNVKPFLVPNAEMLRTKGPNPLKSHAYAQDYNEVKSLGSLTSTTRTADQTTAAIFWQSQPGGLFGQVMAQLASRPDIALGVADTARLYAMTSLAAADAAIGCWNDKYYWNFWRPTDAIREGDNDGNPDTAGDAGWLPLFDPSVATNPATALLFTPAFPDHPSGHSCASSAALNVMRDFFHTDKLGFDIVSSRFPGAANARHYDSFSDALNEIIEARIWGGIHFREADVQGATLGKEVARYERAHFFKALDDE